MIMAVQVERDADGSVIEYWLTTVDNPFDPTTQFPEWFAFDEARGYHTSGLLARIVRTSDDLSDADQAVAIQEAIAEIVDINALGLYRRVRLQ